jgi:hypothetical protein
MIRRFAIQVGHLPPWEVHDLVRQIRDQGARQNVAAESSRVDDDLCITLDGDSIKTLAYEEAIKHSLLSQRRS